MTLIKNSKDLEEDSRDIVGLEREKHENKLKYLEPFLSGLRFHRISLKVSDLAFGNLKYFYEFLPVLEQYPDLFDDTAPKLKDNYGKWLDMIFALREACEDWFYIVTYETVPVCCVWASQWQSWGGDDHAVTMGGVAKRGINPGLTQAVFYSFLLHLFNSTPVSIVRAETAETNRAAKICLLRAGFSHPEARRGWKIQGGQDVTAIIMSISRKEFEHGWTIRRGQE